MFLVTRRVLLNTAILSHAESNSSQVPVWFKKNAHTTDTVGTGFPKCLSEERTLKAASFSKDPILSPKVCFCVRTEVFYPRCLQKEHEKFQESSIENNTVDVVGMSAMETRTLARVGRLQKDASFRMNEKTSALKDHLGSEYESSKTQIVFDHEALSLVDNERTWRTDNAGSDVGHTDKNHSWSSFDNADSMRVLSQLRGTLSSNKETLPSTDVRTKKLDSNSTPRAGQDGTKIEIDHVNVTTESSECRFKEEGDNRYHNSSDVECMQKAVDGLLYEPAISRKLIMKTPEDNQSTANRRDLLPFDSNSIQVQDLSIIKKVNTKIYAGSNKLASTFDDQCNSFVTFQPTITKASPSSKVNSGLDVSHIPHVSLEVQDPGMSYFRDDLSKSLKCDDRRQPSMSRYSLPLTFLLYSFGHSGDVDTWLFSCYLILQFLQRADQTGLENQWLKARLNWQKALLLRARQINGLSQVESLLAHKVKQKFSGQAFMPSELTRVCRQVWLSCLASNRLWIANVTSSCEAYSCGKTLADHDQRPTLTEIYLDYIRHKVLRHFNGHTLKASLIAPVEKLYGGSSSKAVKILWKPPYHFVPPTSGVQTDTSGAPIYWSYRRYVNSFGQQPRLKLCRTKSETHIAIKDLLEESVVGFDMEWKAGSSSVYSIKDKISVIQLATEAQIVIVQLALFDGETIEELLPDSLRQLIEDPGIVKTGVNISGDCTRLTTHLGISPRGTIELSNIHKLVKYSSGLPEDIKFIDRKFVKLDDLVLQHLGLPMSKDQNVRCSAWNKELDREQTEYAANDAYACHRLYHVLEGKRKALVPMPPRPSFAELKLPLILATGQTVAQYCKEHGISGSLPVTKPCNDGSEDNTDTLCMVRDFMAMATGELHQEPDCFTSRLSTSVSPRKRATLSPEVKEADSWAADTIKIMSETQKYTQKILPSQLRAYYLWHYKHKSIDAIAVLLRDPPLQKSTVVSYIVKAVKNANLPHDLDSFTELLKPPPS